MPQVEGEQQVEPRVHQRRQDHAAHQHLEAEEAPRPQLAPQSARAAHVHEIGLHPALQPAGALPLPDAESRRRLLPGRRVQHADVPAGARQADAEVGVLGDVVGIPAADGVEHGAREMVRRAAERHRQPQPLQRRQDAIEQRRVFDGELAREPGGVRVVDVELRLQAAEALAAGAQRRQRAAQLVGLGRVLGVVDDDVVAARKLQGVLDGARLGARRALGNDEHLHVRIELGAGERRPRLAVDGLDDEHHLEPLGRVVEGAQRSQQVANDARFAEQRHQHRVDRQRCSARSADGRRLRQRMRELPQRHACAARRRTGRARP